MRQPEITVCGAHWCPDCRRSKQFLCEHQIPLQLERKERVMTPAGRNGGKVLPPAWIEVIDETDADEALAVAYAECADSTTDQTAWQRPKLAK